MDLQRETAVVRPLFLPAQSVEASLCQAWPRSAQSRQIARRLKQLRGDPLGRFWSHAIGIQATCRFLQQDGYPLPQPGPGHPCSERQSGESGGGRGVRVPGVIATCLYVAHSERHLLLTLDELKLSTMSTTTRIGAMKNKRNTSREEPQPVAQVDNPRGELKACSYLMLYRVRPPFMAARTLPAEDKQFVQHLTLRIRARSRSRLRSRPLPPVFAQRRRGLS
eukprot:1632380-Pleurochrysis_carterae.AAC.3